MRVIEQFTEGKTGMRPSEDRLCVTADFCAAIDGSTSKATQNRSDTPSTGFLAAQILSDALRSLTPEADAYSTAERFTTAIAKYYTDHGLTQTVCQHPERRLTASMVVYSKQRKEIWLYGDCQFRIAGRTYTHLKKVDNILSGIRADIIRYLLRHGVTKEELQRHDLGRSFIYDALRDQCAFQNATSDIPYAYPVIDGFNIRREQIVVHKLPPHHYDAEPTEIILATDGYPVLCDTLEETETRLHNILRADPLMTDLYPTTKGLQAGARSFDDRSYLRFTDDTE